jgi:hypothetical protein
MTKRVNESLSSSNLSLRNEVALKVDALTHQWAQGLLPPPFPFSFTSSCHSASEHANLSSRIDLLQKQSQDTSHHHQALLSQEISHLTQGHDTLVTDVQKLQHQAQQTDQDLVELHEIMKEVTQYLTESKKTTQALEDTVQEMSDTNQPMIDSLYNRIRENNEKIQRFEDLLQDLHERFQGELQEERQREGGQQASRGQESFKTEWQQQHLRKRGEVTGGGSMRDHRGDDVDEMLLKHEERLQEITSILEEQHTDYQETISKLSASNRKLKLKVKELYDKMGPLGEIKGSIDQILADILQGTSDDKHVINSLKEENTQLITEVLSMKILCENMEEKYEELRRTSLYHQQQGQGQGRDKGQGKGDGKQDAAVFREQFEKLEEKIGALEGTVQEMFLSENSTTKRITADSMDHPMGISEIHAAAHSAAADLRQGEGSQQRRDGNENKRSHLFGPSLRRGAHPSVVDEDALSLISDTWHGTLVTHESKPHLSPPETSPAPPPAAAAPPFPPQQPSNTMTLRYPPLPPFSSHIAQIFS